MNEDATGQRVADKSSPRAYLRLVFAKRSLPNPFYWTMFLLMACPVRYIPLNIYRVWNGFFIEHQEALLVGWR